VIARRPRSSIRHPRLFSGRSSKIFSKTANPQLIPNSPRCPAYNIDEEKLSLSECVRLDWTVFPVFVGLNVILADTLRHRSFELLVRKRCCGPNDVPFARDTKDALARWFALEFFLSQLTPVKYGTCSMPTREVTHARILRRSIHA
jgi:hypothetical protein